MDMGVHKLMKTTTYKIGKAGADAPNEKFSSKQTFFTNKLAEEKDKPKYDKNSRRSDPANPNKVITVGFGHGAEKGTVEDHTQQRKETYYSHYYQAKRPDLMPGDAQQINR